MDNIKKLCEFKGGSHLYHLNTHNSDIDVRGLYMNTDAKHIIGTAKNEEYRKQNPNIQQDIVYKELSAWVRLLHQGNTEAFEMLFASSDSFTLCAPEFNLFRAEAHNLIDSRKLFNVLRGYAQSEFRLAKGERAGVLGSKRKESLNTYGYSYRNATHLLRLLWTGIHFFRHQIYVVNCRDFGADEYNYLMKIKATPERYSVEQLEADYKQYDAEIVAAYESRTRTFTFSEKIANNLLLRCYFPYLKLEYQKVLDVAQ